MKCAAQQITAARGPQPPSKIHCTNKQNAFELIDFAPELGLDCWFCCSINSWLLQTTIKIYCFCCIQRDDDCDAGLAYITKQLSILSSLSMVKQILHCCCCFCWNVVQRRINSNSVGGLKSIWPIFVLRLLYRKKLCRNRSRIGAGNWCFITHRCITQFQSIYDCWSIRLSSSSLFIGVGIIDSKMQELWEQGNSITFMINARKHTISTRMELKIAYVLSKLNYALNSLSNFKLKIFPSRSQQQNITLSSTPWSIRFKLKIELNRPFDSHM